MEQLNFVKDLEITNYIENEVKQTNEKLKTKKKRGSRSALNTALNSFDTKIVAKNKNLNNSPNSYLRVDLPRTKSKFRDFEDDQNSNLPDDYEPLLTPNKGRFVLFPINYDKIWEMYKLAESSFWTVEDIDLSTDIIHWHGKLNADERYFITMVLAFFAGSDGIVNENLAVKFMSQVQIPEAR
jgi:hypothetical protein